MFVRKLLKYIRICGIAGLCLFAAFHPQFFKQNNTQLLRRIDIKFFACQCIDFFCHTADLFIQQFLVSQKGIFIHFNAVFFHICQNINEWHFHIIEQAFLFIFFQFFIHHFSGTEENFRLSRCKSSSFTVRKRSKRFFCSSFAENFFRRRIGFIQKCIGNIIIFIRISCCI